jgi:hypothetical protein
MRGNWTAAARPRARSLQGILVIILISYDVGYNFIMNVLTCETE